MNCLTISFLLQPSSDVLVLPVETHRMFTQNYADTKFIGSKLFNLIPAFILLPSSKLQQQQQQQ